MPVKINSTILVAPLDWGIGHATRCIPIIHRLLQLDCNVIIAAEGLQKQLLQLEFPSLIILQIPGYGITYSKSKRLLPIKIVAQLPKILKAIRTEHLWLQKAIKKHGITAVISDNRYGMYNSTITSIIITHQLTIKAPSAFLERLIQKLSYRLLNRFNECWVPDQEGMPNLAGVLSHPRHLPAAPVKYLGALSRLRKLEHWQKSWDVLCILSGPEPQRTLLENKLLLQLRQYNGQVLLIRGLPGSTTELPGFKNVRIVNHLPASELEQHLVASEIVISRSGYTTVMDLCKLQKKAIFIPTPGQTEQEYLAQHLHKQQWCLYFTQEEFQLEVALAEAKKFTFSIPEINMDTYHLVVDEFVKSLAAATIPNSTFAGK